MSQDHSVDRELIVEASELIHVGLDRAKDLVRQAARALREHAPTEVLPGGMQDDPQPLN